MYSDDTCGLPATVEFKVYDRFKEDDDEEEEGDDDDCVYVDKGSA